MESLRLTSLTILLLLAAFGCENKNNPSTTSPARQADETSILSGIPARLCGEFEGYLHRPLTTLDQEAAQLAIDHWKPTKSGESWYICQIKTREGHPDLRQVFELREVALDVSAWGQISEADRLNGLESSVKIWLRAEAIRDRSRERPNVAYDTNQGKWKDGGKLCFIRFQRVNGKWTREEMDAVNMHASVNDDSIQFIRVEPSQLSQ
jgi:hypothetical protein